MSETLGRRGPANPLVERGLVRLHSRKLGDEFKLRVARAAARARPSEVVLDGPAPVAVVLVELATRAEVLVRLATVKVVLVELSTDT